MLEDQRAKLEAIKRTHKLGIAYATRKKQTRAKCRKMKQDARRLRKADSPKQSPQPKQYTRPQKLAKRPNYAEYIASKLWRQVRRWRIRLAGFACEQCGHKKTLHVHHRHYDTLGREDACDLAVWCKDCHERFHEGLITSKSHLASIQSES